MKLHHTGYLTGNIAETAKTFETLGYEQQPIFDDTIQKCHICFLKREEGEPLIELVQPYETNRSMLKLLEKHGVSPYHICFEVENVQSIYNEYSEIEGWIPMFKPIGAIAFNNRKITYFMNAEIGFVEFVSEK